jgi:hypothetical protein
MGKYFDTLSGMLEEPNSESFSQYKIMKTFDCCQATAKKVKETLKMKVKEAKFLKKMSENIEVYDEKLIPIVMYLLKENNYFKTTQDIIDEKKWSRYLIKQAKEIIQDYIKENMK